MLPPVRTMSGSSGSYQNSSSVSASGYVAGEPIFPGQAADADRDVNPNLAGKLNILLLSGRDTVAEGLSMLADALGKSIDMPRRSGESGAAYVQRLAVVLANLNPVQRAEAERQLALLVRGIRLQLVIDAFLNPSGPEAARVVALLEMAGSKERDLATRTVLTSYQQNDGAEFELEFHGPRPMPPVLSEGAPALVALPAPAVAVPGASLTASADGSPASPAADPAEAPAQPADGTNPGEAPFIVTEDFDEDPELVIFHQETDNIFSRTSEKPLTDREAAAPRQASERGSHGQESLRNLATTGTLRQGAGPIGDARSLQSVLENAFAQGESADPVIQAKAAMQLLAGEEARPAPMRDLGQSRRDFAAKPFIDYTRPPPRPQGESEPFSSLLALKGWTEGEISGLPLLPASLEAEAVLAAALSPHAGPEPDSVHPGFQLRGRGTAANDMPPAHKSALSAAEQQLLRNADEAAGLAADRRLDLQVHRELSATEALLSSALQLSQDLRLAIPYATHPYPVETDAEETSKDRSGYRASEDEAEDEEDGEGQSPDQPPQDHDETLVLVAGGDEEQAIDMADPAYDLYQRMAGWN